MSSVKPSFSRTTPFVLAGVLMVVGAARLSAHDFRLSPNACAIGGERTGAQSRDSADVAAAVHAYDRALREGDSTAALALLAPDAVILESGGIETREEYRSHHLPGDIAYARAVPSESGPVHVRVRGDVAWAWSTSSSQGEYRGRQINSAGAELMVLVRTPTGWKISAIHWSSRARRPAP